MGKSKRLTDHQAANLRYIANAYRRGESLMPGCLNMSVLAALLRRDLVRIIPTPEADAALAEAEGPRHV